MQVGDPKELLRCMRKLLIGMEAKEGQGRGCPLPLNDVIPLFTSNPAQRLKLSNKGIVGAPVLDLQETDICSS